MSDSTPQPPSDVSEPSAKRPRWLVLLSVVVVSMLVGAISATAAIVFSGRYEREHQFSVVVFLDRNVTPDQKASLQSALAALQPVGEVRFESREDALKNAQEMVKDQPELLAGIDSRSMPESFSITFSETVFDCARLTPARRMPGVEQIKVFQRPEGRRPGADIACGNLL